MHTMRESQLVLADRPVGRKQDSDRAIGCVAEVNIARAIDSNGTRTGDGCISGSSAITRIAQGAIPRDGRDDPIRRDFADSVVAAVSNEEVARAVHGYT